jgi:hypothetical protein
MSFVSDFEFDIFVSYAHVDNLTAAGNSKGWVVQFQQHLEIQLWKRVGRTESVKIWWDPALDGNQLFDKTIQNRVQGSALFLALTSAGYLASDYCGQELRCFHQKAHGERYGLSVGDRLRIFNILLNNVPHADWPKEYGRSSGFPFHDAHRDEEFGQPVEPGDKLFQQQLRSLVDSIFRTLLTIKEAQQPPSGVKDPASRENDSFTIYVADTADSLRTTRKRLISDLLQQKNIRVVTNIPPPYEPGAHEGRVTEELKKGDLSVHLLDELPGREIEGLAGLCYPQAQAELAMTHSRLPFIWVPQKMESIDDDGYREFLSGIETGSREERKYDFIRGSPATIVREILEKVTELKAHAIPLECSPAAALLDTHFKDQLYALELSRFLLERQVQPYINPEEDDPRKNLSLFEERLKQVSLLIIFFGNVAEEWVRARLAAALQIVVAEGYPLKACGVYLAPPCKPKSSFQLWQKLLPIELMDNTEGFNPTSVMRLLDRMKLG